MLNIALYTALGLAAVIIAVVAYAATKPDTFRVARSIAITAPPEAIYPLISDLRKFATWSPFEKQDPNMRRVFSGPENGKGQRYDWDGNRQIGKGWLIISEASAPSKVDIDLNMLTPMKASNQVTFTLVPERGATKVTWAMQGQVPLYAKVIHLFVDMDRMCGNAFQDGLASLKAIAEGAVAAPAQP